MENLQSLLYFFLLLSIGYSSSRSNLLSESADSGITQLLMNLCYPATIISCFACADVQQLVNSGLKILLGTVISDLACILILSHLLRKRERKDRQMLCFMLCIGNITYIGIPLFRIFLPTSAIPLFILHGTLQDFFIWLYFFPAFALEKKRKISDLFSNPCLIALCIGLILMLFRFSLPSFIGLTFDALSGMTAPLAILYLGMVISRQRQSKTILCKDSIQYAFSKVLIIPTILFVICRIVTDLQTAFLLGLMFSCPAPLMSIVWAKQFDIDTEVVSSRCVTSMLLFLIVAVFILWFASPLLKAG